MSDPYICRREECESRTDRTKSPRFVASVLVDEDGDFEESPRQELMQCFYCGARAPIKAVLNIRDFNVTYMVVAYAGDEVQYLGLHLNRQAVMSLWTLHQHSRAELGRHAAYEIVHRMERLGDLGDVLTDEQLARATYNNKVFKDALDLDYDMDVNEVVQESEIWELPKGIELRFPTVGLQAPPANIISSKLHVREDGFAVSWCDNKHVEHFRTALVDWAYITDIVYGRWKSEYE